MTKPIQSRDRFNLTLRVGPIFVGFLLLQLLVVGRVWYLQNALGREFRKRSEVNRIKHVTLPAQRGVIRDVEGRVLAADEPTFHLQRSRRARLGDRQTQSLAEGLKIRPALLHGRLDSERRIILRGLTDAQRIWFEEHSHQYPGFRVRIRPQRVYQYDTFVASVVGYTGEISRKVLNHRRSEGLSQGDIVGKSGIEKAYDVHLQGRDGIRWVETTARGDHVRTLTSPQPIPPRNGSDLQLHIDAELQQRIAHTFPADSEGAAVVMEIPSGHVRALYSHPNYDPNKMVLGEPETIQMLLDAPGDPLHNRVVQSRFPPGSTFKLLPYLAALKEPNYQPSQSFFCGGEYWFGGRKFRCWEEQGHGTLSLDQALVHSCNIYFYKLVRQLGIQPIAAMGRRVSYAERTGIDMPDETTPQLSSPSWKRRELGTSWYPGDALNSVIGQGYTLVSPIKQAQVLGSLVTGRTIHPRVAQSPDTPGAPRRLPISSAHLQRLRETLDQIADEGTGYWAQHTPNYRSIDVDLLGKTGTVQKVKPRDAEDTPPADAWFISAAPSSDPRYVVVVFRADGGSGGQVAAPHAREIYQIMLELEYFDRPRPGPRSASVPQSPLPREPPGDHGVHTTPAIGSIVQDPVPFPEHDSGGAV